MEYLDRRSTEFSRFGSEHLKEGMVSLVAQINRRMKPGTLILAGVLSISPAAWAATFSPCDLNQDGVVNGTDVTLAINMALGTTSCTAGLEAANTCTVITVQRVVNASQGQTCITYNSHGVTLNWGASTSQNVAGYNVYRGTTSGGPYTKLNTTGLITVLTYLDSAVLAGQTYYYVATTVDINSNESAYSAQTTATIPTP
jgi:hypothetical protein